MWRVLHTAVRELSTQWLDLAMNDITVAENGGCFGVRRLPQQLNMRRLFTHILCVSVACEVNSGA